MTSTLAGEPNEAVQHADESVRTAVTAFERRLSAVTKAIAEISLGDAEHGLDHLVEAIGVASESGWRAVVDYGITFVGVGHVLLGEVDKGIRVIESAIAEFDARGHIFAAMMARVILAEVYLAMLTSRAALPLFVTLKNLGVILRVKFSGVRRIKALLERAARAPQGDERGVIRARMHKDMGLLHKFKKEPDLAREFLEKARAPAELQGAASLVAEIDAALAELR
jgi:hypothetical protein